MSIETRGSRYENPGAPGLVSALIPFLGFPPKSEQWPELINPSVPRKHVEHHLMREDGNNRENPGQKEGHGVSSYGHHGTSGLETIPVFSPHSGHTPDVLPVRSYSQLVQTPCRG